MLALIDMCRKHLLAPASTADQNAAIRAMEHQCAKEPCLPVPGLRFHVVSREAHAVTANALGGGVGSHDATRSP